MFNKYGKTTTIYIHVNEINDMFLITGNDLTKRKLFSYIDAPV